MVRRFHVGGAVAVIVGSLTASPAQALLSRAWVSGKGSDTASCGPVQTPCRTLQYVHDSIIAAGGEINFLDSAGYGSLSISKALNVVNSGSIAGVLAGPGANAITVNAGVNDSVLLQGLIVEGSNAGANGLKFNSGQKLVVSDCLFQGFVGSGTNGNGIVISPTGGAHVVVVTDTQAINNSNAGLYVTDSAASVLTLSVEQSIFGNNGSGIVTTLTSGTTSVLNQFAITDTLAVNNNSIGMSFTVNASPKLVLTIDTGRVTGNLGDGVVTTFNNISQLHIGRSVIAGNNFGLRNTGGSNNTFGDNRINENATGDVLNALTAIPGK